MIPMRGLANAHTYRGFELHVHWDTSQCADKEGSIIHRTRQYPYRIETW